MTHPSFDLVDQPWIPVAMLPADGDDPKTRNIELSLRDLFHRAHEIRGFNEPSPLTYVSVARLLLAIAHRALDGPESPRSWVELWRAGRFDAARFDAYLDRWRHRFDLFHPEQPFAQADAKHDLGTEASPLSRFLLEEASVSATTLFDHSHDLAPRRYSPAQATRALLTAQNYAFAGTGGRFRDATLIRGYVLLLEGESLFQTLVLNLVEYNDHAPKNLDRRGDAPWWEQPTDREIKKEGSKPRGYTDLLTWRSRWLRLQPEPDGSVVRSPYRQRYFLPQSEIDDPFLAFSAVVGGANKNQIITRKFSVDRALWRDGHVLLEHGRTSADRSVTIPRPGIVDWFATAAAAARQQGVRIPRPSVVVSGLSNNQAKVHLWRQERLPLPVTAAQDPNVSRWVGAAINHAETAHRALASAGRSMAKALLTEGNRSLDKNDVANQLAQLRLSERYWPRLELAFHELLTDLDGDTDPEDRELVWRDTVVDLARDAFEDAALTAAGDARGYRAQALGCRTLNYWLAELKTSPEGAAT